jgi:predicted nucleic acid-binding protein
MELVVDANILVSFFRDNPVRFIIINSNLLGLKLYAPEYAIEELLKNKSDILKYSKLNESQLKEVLSTISEYIEIKSDEFFKQFETKARQFSPHDKDLPYFSLAIKLNCAIWSNEPGFKEQSNIDIFNTQDLRDELNII